MDDAGIIPHFTGVLGHDHWKPYYQYTQCQHALCNAHHLRELERAWEQDGKQWAKDIQTLLKDINRQQTDNPRLDEQTQHHYRQQYKAILVQGDIQCPPPDKNSRVIGPSRPSSQCPGCVKTISKPLLHQKLIKHVLQIQI